MEFNPLSEEFFDDPYDTYRWLRDEAPCYRNEELGFWALSRFDDVVAAHRDWKRSPTNTVSGSISSRTRETRRRSRTSSSWIRPTTNGCAGS